MPLLDLEAFRAAPLTREPFTFTVVPHAVPPEAAALHAPNIWPGTPAAYRPVTERYYIALEALGASAEEMKELLDV